MVDVAEFLLAGGRLVRCAIYTRQSVSSDDGLSSCQVQFETCESFVRSQRPVGWLPLSERFDDEGYSGATTERPALQRLLALVRARKVDQVVIHRLDRLSRSVLGCATVLQEFRKFGVGLVIVTALELGHNAHDGFILNILASFAEFEREMIAGRIAESRARLKSRGLRIAGAVPFGFQADPRTKQLVPVEQEGVIVRWMFERAAAGETPAAIAAAANANGWRTKLRTGRRSGKHDGGVSWTARQVVATLRNPVYLGQFREKQGVRFGKHDPIVTNDVFAAVAAQLEARRTRTPGKRYEIEWPLRGRIICAVCDRPMSPHTIRYRNVLYRYYRCRSTAGGRAPCGHQVSAQTIENAVERNVSSELAQESQFWDSIELVAYDHRDGGIRVRLIPPDKGEQPAASDASSKRAGASMLQYEDDVSLRPKFRITNAITGNLTRVERARGFLDAAKLSEDWITGMQQRALVLEAHHTTHIEGTQLTLDQSERVLAGEKPPGVKADDAKEVTNYRKAFDLVADYLGSGDPVTEGLIREIHKRLVRGVRGNAASPGEYRHIQNYVVNSVTKEVIYTPPPPHEVPPLMAEFAAWLNAEQEMHPILVAGIAQFQLVHIHPFLDGNGRTGRLLSMLCLYRKGYDFKRLFTLSEYYDSDRPSYYRAIQSVRQRELDLTEWLEYFTTGLTLQLAQVQEKGESLIRLDVLMKKHSLSARQRAALELALVQTSFQIQDLEAKCPGVHRRSLQRDLRGLMEKHLLVAEGATNRLLYRASGKL